MKEIIRNITHAQVLPLKEQVTCLEGQIVSKTLAQNEDVSITLFAFWQGEEISTHTSNGDAMVIVLDGQGKITIDKTEYILTAGETIVMPAKNTHAVYAVERFKMLLIVIFPE